MTLPRPTLASANLPVTRAIRATGFVLTALCCVSAPAQSPTSLQWFERSFQGATVRTPERRTSHRLVFDSARKLGVLIGGTGTSGTDVWERDAAGWNPTSPASRPQRRYDHGAAYDAERRECFVFGGRDSRGLPLSDVWAWDGSTWSSRPSGPAARYGHGMTYDARRKVVVLFGGFDGSSILGDTWEWDGARWQNVTATGGPLPRRDAAMAYDSTTGEILLFGGEGTIGGRATMFNDLWAYDGQWKPKFIAGTLPPHRSRHVAVYDDAEAKLLIFGGKAVSGVLFDDLWSWNAGGYQKLSTSGPSAREGAAAYYDAAADVTVLFGGAPRSSAGTDDTWDVVAVPSYMSVPGSGHGGGGLRLECSPPKIGTTVVVSFANSPQRVFPGGYNLLALGPALSSHISLPPPVACTTGNVWVVALVFLQTSGNPATFAIPVPNDPLLVGQGIGLQGGSLEATNCYRLTDGVRIVML